ncbi:MAG: ATP-dependent DNA helicase RecG, partial [Planctomycetota bacterium]|nr:ATP-dependent DNA helicase RecG [Planctomycetota bacterium]
MLGQPPSTAAPNLSTLERLNTPVRHLRGVTDVQVEQLARLELHYVRDLLFFFPRDYQDLTDFRSIVSLEEDKLQSVRGVVEEIDLRGGNTGRSILGVLIRDESQYLRAIWFNQPYMRTRFKLGQEIVCSGKPVMRGMRWEIVHPRVQWLDPDEESPSGTLLPIYSLTEGLKQPQIRQIVRNALEQYADALEEVFPDSFRETHDLWPLARALPAIHFPQSQEERDCAKRRFVYQE